MTLQDINKQLEEEVIAYFNTVLEEAKTDATKLFNFLDGHYNGYIGQIIEELENGTPFQKSVVSKLVAQEFINKFYNTLFPTNNDFSEEATRVQKHYHCTKADVKSLLKEYSEEHPNERDKDSLDSLLESYGCYDFILSYIVIKLTSYDKIVPKLQFYIINNAPEIVDTLRSIIHEEELPDEDYDEGFDESLENNVQRLREDEEDPYVSVYELRFGEGVEIENIKKLRVAGCYRDSVFIYIEATILPKEYEVTFYNKDDNEFYSSSADSILGTPNFPKVQVSGQIEATFEMPITLVSEEVRKNLSILQDLANADTGDEIEDIDRWRTQRRKVDEILTDPEELKGIKDYLSKIKYVLATCFNTYYTDEPFFGEDTVSFDDEFKIECLINKRTGQNSIDVPYAHGIARVTMKNKEVFQTINDIIRADLNKIAPPKVILSDEDYDEGFDESLNHIKRRLFV